MDLKEKVIDEIKKIYDPEIPVNIYELGLIYDVLIIEKVVKVKMTLTTPNCPVAESLPKEVKDSIMQIDGVDKVDLDLVWEPPWDKSMTKQIISLSENAAKRIKEIMSGAEKNSLGVRVGVKSGGCAGMSYVMEYAKEINPNDEIIEDKGVKVYIDSAAVMYLLGTEMDYKKDNFSTSFTFNNPNETERCGCGESFKI